MSSYHSDKCSPDELKEFKQEVIKWLNDNFIGWNDKFKIKAFPCYNGDIRLYDGDYQEFPNMKSSFRRKEPNYNDKGEIIGWSGTRGVHSKKIINYISINKDEFEDIKMVWREKSGEDYFFFDDLIFRRLKKECR